MLIKGYWALWELVPHFVPGEVVQQELLQHALFGGGGTATPPLSWSRWQYKISRVLEVVALQLLPEAFLEEVALQFPAVLALQLPEGKKHTPPSALAEGVTPTSQGGPKEGRRRRTTKP